MDPKIIHANGADLCVQIFGERADPAVLLVMGAAASMDYWEDDFCARLAAGPRYVVRYDHRDTGRSTSYPPGAPGYTGDDLVADAVALLDALDVRAAHVVGLSMGGAIAQLMALDHRERVASLTLIATSPAGPGEPDLPPMTDEGRAAFGALAEPDWADRAAVIDYLTALSRACASRSHPFDEQGTRALCARVLDRTTNIASSTRNHYAADGGDRWRDRLGEIDAPTLVVHGTEDPVFPHGHGAALAREIPGAELLTLAGTGHELPRRDWDLVVPAILRLTRES
ncbi:MAG TPA: alpha/beta hydrolase [Solirubrobacteraceae bacterium]|nr:alpha/beta hydrolase [Solirubrobacteraceae bacterium]